MVSKALTTFDYSVLDKDDKGKLQYLAGEIRKANGSHLKFGLEVGEAVAKAHAILACDGRDGQFTAWIESECGFGKTTAYKYMHVWEQFNDCEVIGQFDLSALQTLSAAGVPEAARKEAVKWATKGHRITNDRSKEIVGQFIEKPAPKPKNKGVIVHNVNDSTPTESPVSVTEVGSSNPPADPPNAGGVCPKGGDHNWDDTGTCTGCFSPDGPVAIPPVVPIDPSGFDPANIEAHAESFSANFAAKVKAHNLEIERFARKVMEAFADPPGSVWLDESRLGIALDQVKSACATIRQAKAHDKPCPKCDGKGSHTGKPCKWCKGTGFMPERSYEMAGGQ